jgi:prefoldin beta subunit
MGFGLAEVVPPELEQYAAKLQQLRARLGQVQAEKGVVQAELRDIERALEILKNAASDATVFKSAGHLMVRVTKEDAEKELSDRKDILELRLKALERQEASLNSEIKDLEAKINEVVGRYYGRKGGGGF